MKRKMNKGLAILVIVFMLTNLVINCAAASENDNAGEYFNIFGDNSTGQSDIDTVKNPKISDGINSTYFSESFDGNKKDIILPLVTEGKQSEDFSPLKEHVTVTTQVFDKSFQLSDGVKTNSFSVMSIPLGAIPVNEGEIKILNDEMSEEKFSSYTFVFTPSTTGCYKITATGPEIPYIYIYDSDYNSLGWNRTYPKMNDSVAAKLIKDQQYIINLYSVSFNYATELSISKYESASNNITYTFIDNTYTIDENASVIVTVPYIGADILYGVLGRDILIEARLLKDGVLIESIDEIPSDCIKGARGNPDDNVLQFVCEFGKKVEHGEYTIEITCKDISGNIVIDTCESAITIGNPVSVYMPSDSVVYTADSSNDQRVYFKDVNTDRGKFLVFDGGKIIGTSNSVYIYSTRISYDDFFSTYSIIDGDYDYNKFEKTLYYSNIPSINLNEVSKKEKSYDVKLVTGVSEYDTTAKLIPTDVLILNYASASGLYDSVNNFKVYTQFYNIRNINMDDISVELIDLYGNVVARKTDYICYSAINDQNQAYLQFNMLIEKPLEAYKNYSLKISYPDEIYTNVKS